MSDNAVMQRVQALEQRLSHCKQHRLPFSRAEFFWFFRFLDVCSEFTS